MAAASSDTFFCKPHLKGVNSSACTSCCPGTCHGSGKMWIVAACEGHMALYEKGPGGGAELIPIGQDVTPWSLENLVNLLKTYHAQKQFEQLLIVGSQNDLSWVQSLLPEEVANCVVAEIRYPLMAGWFSETPNMKTLSSALRTLLVG